MVAKVGDWDDFFLSLTLGAIAPNIQPPNNIMVAKVIKNRSIKSPSYKDIK
ncbi:MAG: hypothetical protein H0U45_17220 [Tatlockia sp.]|nr:hypothetical protein [Tatlockia sp.]